MQSEETLRATLERIDGRGYKAYSALRDGCYRVGELELSVDRVQGDPFATPSKIRLRHPHAAAGLPERLTANAVARIAFRDWLARRVQRFLAKDAAASATSRRGSGGSGQVSIDAGAQAVLDRCAIRLDGDALEARLEVGLPAAGRRILGRAACALLLDGLPGRVARALELDEAVCEDAAAFVACVENQETIRSALEAKGLVAFVADASLLPRRSGIDDTSLPSGVPFSCPPTLRVDFELPHPPGRISGLGIRRGVTVIVGGGYHGKSTLLRALEHGVYPHIPGDGREGVVSDARAVKIRAEDGRRVEGVAIEPFIRNLPLGRDTSRFRSDDASGSTSQAANVLEALEVGARVLLMDEDSCATNFMTRDARMQALVAPDREPITPLVDRVRELFEEHGVSTILVAGSSGDFFGVADTVIEMENFLATDRSADARALAAGPGSTRAREATGRFAFPAGRIPELGSLDPAREASGRGGRHHPRITARDLHHLRYGNSELELSGLEQLVDMSQTRAIGNALQWIALRGAPALPLAAHLDALDAHLDAEGVEGLSTAPQNHHPGALARPRRFEIASALNRLRTLRTTAGDSDQ